MPMPRTSATSHGTSRVYDVTMGTGLVVSREMSLAEARRTRDLYETVIGLRHVTIHPVTIDMFDDDDMIPRAA